jgi:PAS domain S-box-containing protein
MNTESALLSQATLYHRLVERLPEAVALIDTNRHILLVNEAFCEVTGYSEQEWMAIGSIDVLFSRELDSTHPKQLFESVQGEMAERELFLVRKDHHFFRALLKSVPLADQEGKTIGKILIISDVTAQRKQMDAMIANDERLRILMQSTSEGIIIHENGTIVDINDAIEHTYGYTREDLLGKSVFQFTSPKEHASMRQVFRDKLMFAGEREIIDKEGRSRRVEVRSKLVMHRDRELRVITLRDVTELHQKQAEQERLIAILEASPEFVAMMDSGGLSYMNRTGRKMLGYEDNEEISHLTVNDFLSPSSAELILNVGMPCAIEFGLWQGQTTFRRKDGSEFSAQQIVIAHKDADGKVDFFASLATDITERLRAEEIRKENQQRLKYFMEESLEAIIIHEQGRIIDFNSAAFKMFGYDSDELFGKPVLQLYDTSFRKEILDRINRAQIIKDEWIGVKKDGARFDIEVYSRPHIYKDRDVRVVSILDISTRKKTERALRSSELMLNAAVEGTNVGIWEWNLVTNKMTFNDTYRKILRLRPGNLPGSFDDWKQTIHATDQQGLLEALKNHLHGLTPMFHFVYHSGTEKEPLILETKGKLVRNENNMPVRIVGTTIDITEQQQIEDALRRSRAQLAALIENREETIWAIDPEMRLMNFNNSFAQIFRTMFNIEPRNGIKITGGLEPELARTWEERYRKCLQGETLVFVEEYEIEGRKIFVEFSANPMRLADDAVVGVSVLGREITQQKNFEHSLQEAKLAAETANRTKSQFLANISHEIRTPMNGIIGFTELLLQTKVNEKQKEYLEIVRYSADSLLNLINDLLDISKIEAGKLTLAKREFDLRKLMRDVIKSFKAKVKQQNLKLTLSISEDVPPVLIGDEMRLQQVFVNLIGNAVKFSDHGTISVSLSLGAKSAGSAVINAEVADEGIGIPKDRLESIFEAFHQVSDPRTSKYGGTGLGLSITRKLLEMMHGSIGVESEQGKGSRFSFDVKLGLPASA